MSLGFFTLHPVSYPMSDQLTNAVVITLGYMCTVYCSIIKPELAELLETIRLSC